MTSVSRRIYSFPHWTNNPFVNLLFLDAQSQGWTVVQSRLLEDFVRLVSDSGDGDVIHIHWTSPIVQRAADESDAARRRAWFETVLRDAMRRGTRVVWSIHNVLPHDVKYRDEEIALCQFLSDASTRIHVLSSRTREFVGDLYNVDPAKMVRVPHSSYWGVYDQTITRDEARSSFELAESDIAIGFVGQLRPYKGVDTLIRAVELLQREDPRVVLLMAGKTSEEDERIFDDLVAPVNRVVRVHEFVPDEDLPRWMRAIDIMALPYREVLNSGSVALAATFGVPVVTPAQAGFARDFEGEPWVTTYDSGSSDPVAELVTGLRAQVGDATESAIAATEWARANTPFGMSQRFSMDILETLVEAQGAQSAQRDQRDQRESL